MEEITLTIKAFLMGIGTILGFIIFSPFIIPCLIVLLGFWMMDEMDNRKIKKYVATYKFNPDME